MADQIDPEIDAPLESVLRSILRAEAASVPFRLRSEDVAPRVASTRSRGGPVILLVAAATLLGVLLGGVALSGGGQVLEAVAPSAVPSLDVAGGLEMEGVETFDRMRESISFDREIASGEGDAAANTTTLLRGNLAVPWVQVVMSCSGAGIDLAPTPGGPEPLERRLECIGGLLSFPLVWLTPDTTGGLNVTARGGTAWRAIVIGRSPTVHDEQAPASAVPGLPSYEELDEGAPGFIREVARGAAVARTEDQAFTLASSAASRHVSLAIACRRGPVELSFGTPDKLDVGFGFPVVPCGPTPIFMGLPSGRDELAYSLVRIRVAPGDAWVAVVIEDSLPARSPEP